MKSPYVSELEPNQTIQGTFLVTHKDIRHKKTGEPYLSLTLSDKSGDMDAKMWDNAADVAGAFDKNDFVHVKGLLQVFQNRPQLTIHKLQPVAESSVDLGDYLPASKRDRDEMFRELMSWIGSITDPHLKTLLEALFANESVAQAFRTAPAAKSVHHAYIGGLLEHVLSMCGLAKATAAHYAGIDYDLLLSGVILHDIGKIYELEYARSFSYSDAGQLLGHIHIGIQMVQEQLRQQPDFPPRRRDLLLHLILSHHGELAYGSPKQPLFPEALLLHHIDNLDSKMETMRALIERDPQPEGNWTLYSGILERSALKKERYLNPAPASAKPEPPAGASRSNGPAAQHLHQPPPRREPTPSPFASKLQLALTPQPGHASNPASKE